MYYSKILELQKQIELSYGWLHFRDLESKLLVELVKELQKENQYLSKHTTKTFVNSNSSLLASLYAECERLNREAKRYGCEGILPPRLKKANYKPTAKGYVKVEEKSL